jgi:hypothetical protein
MWKNVEKSIVDKIKDILVDVGKVEENSELNSISIETEQRIFEFNKLKKLQELFLAEEIIWKESEIRCNCEFGCDTHTLTTIIIRLTDKRH